MIDEMEFVRREIRFEGRVQGVGFRYRAKYAADGHGVTGWVMNEYDGTVLMEAQGRMGQINEMLKTINASPYIKIYRIDYKELPIDESEKGFHIR